MKPKKNPKADLRRSWVLFLQIGLIVTLFITLQAFQWKSYNPEQASRETMAIDNLQEEDVPVTIHDQTPPPPPPPVDPPEIKIAPDDEDVEEDNIASTEVDLDDIVEPEEIIDAEPDEEVTVPFKFIEDVPLFPGCENLDDNSERKSCMSEKISSFVGKEFDTRLGEKLGLTGVNLVTVLFVVNTQGEIEQVQARAPHPKLEEEAKRVISKLPKMKPGKQRGKAVPVSYAIPIRFKVQ
ncbi:energy transducer TonB [Christiangramia portivictoriae]|uniref:energy transducer TonB n=1 Tax=Christiangramia portivictoriae TaxID=326069 RepID=UPI00047D5636|nr:energy transducer TonB [Christiangramia portivictoriae]